MKKIEKGSIVKAMVSGIEKYGAFIVIDDIFNGLIHISEISDDFVRNISDYLYIGEKIKVKVIDVDYDNCQIKASIKNINYKCDGNNRIEETEHGFSTLKECLPCWVNDKLQKL